MATGRRPSTEAWHSIGLALTEREWLNVDRATLEAQPGVFGAGDVTGLGGFTHPAYYHGQVIFGKGATAAQPGSTQDLMLVVDDIELARAQLVGHGVEVSEVFHDEGGLFRHAGTQARVPGPDPKRRSYCSWASFSDPDGNGLLLQEITKRLPGRV